ncbi:D-methionine transport system ATP-binding protein [Gracilibacillus halotolerans]|uniref:D-methionine transport system ATP-binding protein n=1 Tax=Gracilibacillus halotolerans TaxID=74386 RepID=A0A841RLU7_9BACI|nr:methionine ABC transporter ATP-binding protein [Gracilibacillus halotolerans]MBB6513469.1 D-methionine transport system ATP-binding protein [Gracilibacillus halotolerans]
MIIIENVKKIFQTKTGNLTAVDDVNLKINEGEIFGVIGYSGAGKSTLIRMLNGLEKPTSGKLEVSGKDIASIQGKELRHARQKIGMIFQHFNLLWSRTVAENIAFPLEIAKVSKFERQERVQELIQLVGLEGKENAYPSQLSGGQKQRVGIARALANNPTVLLCDEATSALDPETTDSILELLLGINKKLGLTIVLITHEMHVIRKICQRVAVMEDGKVVESGDVLEVFKNPQTPITKKFVGQGTEQQDTKETMNQLLKKYPSGKVVKLTFVGDTAEQPIIQSLLQNVQLTVNILHGNISQTQNGSYGTLLLHLDGTEESIDEAIQYLNQQRVGIEVVNNV